jgi:hypothetical protein
MGKHVLQTELAAFHKLVCFSATVTVLTGLPGITAIYVAEV